MVAERQARVRSTRSWPRMAFFLLLRGAGCISLENGGISSMTKSALEDFRCFEGIAESWELIKTGLVVIAGTSYKLELWHSYSNPDIPYYVSTYVPGAGGVAQATRSVLPYRAQWRRGDAHSDGLSGGK